MIYLFHGSDEQKAREKAFAWVAAARAKDPNVAYVRLAKEAVTETALEEAAASGSLFAKRTLTLIDDPFAKARADDEGDSADTASPVEEKVKLLAASENVVIILAPKLAAAKAKKLAALATKAYAYDAPPRREAARGFNSVLVNALASRKRDALWLEVVRALRQGDAPEMLHGLLHWKARDLWEKGSRSWTREEARALSLALIALLQDSRRKGLDLAESLERFALSV
ncbi:MAG TPA: hypothetical protein VMV50_02320 [Candidatus Paceibacterota bacterium]|nr:hypothetical protein [Candidatus Paceibacterota bacterium]